MNIRFRFLAYFLSLIFLGSVSFAKPGDYLVCPLDIDKDKQLKCCLCDCNLLDRSKCRTEVNPLVCYTKYDEGSDVKKMIDNARKFNANKIPEKLRATFFEKVRNIVEKVYARMKEVSKIRIEYPGAVDKVKGALEDFIKNSNGLFCGYCMVDSMELLGVNKFHEFRPDGVNCFKYAEQCSMCFGEILPYDDAKFCGKCCTCRLCKKCESTYDKCSICKYELDIPKSKCYLFVKHLHSCYGDNDDCFHTDVKIDTSSSFCCTKDNERIVVERHACEKDSKVVFSRLVFSDVNFSTSFHSKWNSIS